MSEQTLNTSHGPFPLYFYAKVYIICSHNNLINYYFAYTVEHRSYDMSMLSHVTFEY